MFGLGRPKITILELAAILFQAVIDPQAESGIGILSRRGFRSEGVFEVSGFASEPL